MIRRLSLLALLGCSTAALPQAFDSHGFNPRSVAMGGTQAAAENDFTAVFYNPALLLGTPPSPGDGWNHDQPNRPSFGLGFSWMQPFTYARVTNNPDNSPFQYQRPPDFSAVTAGADLPLAGIVSRRFAIGFAANVPTSHVYKGDLVDQSVPYYYRYDSAPDRLQLLFAAALRPVDWLTLGVGVQVQSDFGGGPPNDFKALVGTSTGGKIFYRQLTNEINGVTAPTAGFGVSLTDRIRLYGAWRGEMKANYSLPISIELDTPGGGSLDTLGVEVSGSSYYTPHVFTLGGRVRITDALSAGADVSLETWSGAPNPQVSVDVSYSQALAELFSNTCITSRTPTGPAVPPDLCPPGNEAPVNFSNIFVPRVGVEYRLNDDAELRLGYFYRPSMLPPQSGTMNFIDPTLHAISAGGGYAIADPLQMGKRLVFDAAAQVGLMVPQDTVKDRPNRLPDYRAGGTTLDLVVAVRYEF